MTREKYLKADETVQLALITKKDNSSLNKLLAQYEDDLIKIEVAKSQALSNPNYVIDETFIGFCLEEKILQERIDIVKSLQA